MPDRRARLRCHDEIDPGRIGLRPGRGDDFQRLPALQLLRQRRETAIDATGDAGIADVGVHRISEIDCGRALRQLHDVTARREYIDFIWEQIDFDVLDKFETVAGALLYFEQALHPPAGARVATVTGLADIGFVPPVRGDTVVRHL